jgi:hypothetical protein
VNDRTEWLYDRQAPGAANAAQAAAFATHSESDAVVCSNDLVGRQPQIRALPGLVGSSMVAIWAVARPVDQAPAMLSVEMPINSDYFLLCFEGCMYSARPPLPWCNLQSVLTTQSVSAAPFSRRESPYNVQ